MTRAKRKIETDIRLVDLVIELLDARCPAASENPDIRRLTRGKKRIVLLNKADLADPEVTKLWSAWFKGNETRAIAMDSRGRDSISQIRRAAEELMAEKREKDRARGIVGDRPLKAMICGIPNVGKSTFINSVLGKASARTGNQPGVTRGNQWINAGNGLLMLDTPGILWPKFEDRETGLCLAAVGSISDEVFRAEELAMELLGFMLAQYRELLFARYELTEEAYAARLSEMELEVLGVSKEALAALELIAIRRGCLRKKAEPDYERAAKILLDDFRAGRIGRISLQRPA